MSTAQILSKAAWAERRLPVAQDSGRQTQRDAGGGAHCKREANRL
jgi:hypothetical protein